jgi:hypothetical protein
VSEDLSRAPNLYFTLLADTSQTYTCLKTQNIYNYNFDTLANYLLLMMSSSLFMVHSSSICVRKEMFYTASPDVVVTLAFDYQQGSWGT